MKELSRRKFLQATSFAAATASSKRLMGAPKRSPIRVVQIGTQHSHARNKWQTIRAMPDLFDPVGVFEPDPANKKKAIQEPEFANTPWIENANALSGLQIDAVLVETDLPDLIKWAQFSLHSGWHVHVDKPAGMDREGLATLQDLAKKNKLILQMGYMFRYHPAFRFCLETIRKNWIGQVFSVHGEIGKVIDTDRRAQLANTYGGAMMLLGCHLLDLALAFLGEPENVNAFRRMTHPEKDTLYDHEIAVLEYPNAVATIRSMLVEVGGGERRQLVICGDRGTIEIRPLEPALIKLTLSEAAGPYKVGEQTVPIPPVKERYEEQLDDFYSMINGKPSSAPEFTFAHDELLQDVLIQVTSTA